MSRNSPALLPGRRRGTPPPWTSHLPRPSKAGLDRISVDLPRSAESSSSSSTIRDTQSNRIPERTCTVNVVDLTARDEVLLNLDVLGVDVKPGLLMSIVASAADQDRLAGSYYGSLRASLFQRSLTGDASKPDNEVDKRYIFLAKDMSKELKARHQGYEVLIARHIGDAFGMKRGTQVILAPVDEAAPAIEASHVELSFKDMYLSRSDMWRLTVAHLADRTVYQGQVIFFLGSIKATVSTVYVEGRKAQSAFFGRNSRPIFRSESARYMIFIQMAREMWDFDSDGSGEIMFYKVVNGFLPALFKKWTMLQVKHLVSLVLFARVEYDTGLTTELANTTLKTDYYTGFHPSGDRRPYKDFYRVVVSDMVSDEWTTILHQLKREFNNFRRDISLDHLGAMSEAVDPTEEDSAVKPDWSTRVRAESSLAMHGNFLEAINLASSQYAQDYIDRDLLRTGISIVVISPGTGVFDVEYDNLRRTTEALLGNGIGIDLICIPQTPLHSVPLFRYRNPDFVGANQRLGLAGFGRDTRLPTPVAGSYSGHGHLLSSSDPSMEASMSPLRATDASNRLDGLTAGLPAEEWAFALPQWLHVSYWTGKSDDALAYHGISLSTIGTSLQDSDGEFVTRCILYDLQMRSVLETNEIETTPLHADPTYPVRLREANGLHSGPRKDSQPLGVFDPVHGFDGWARLAAKDNSPLWKELQRFDESRAKLPASRGRQRASFKTSRDLDEATRTQPLGETGNTDSSSLQPSSRAPSAPAVNVPASSILTAPKTKLVKMPNFLRHLSLGKKGFDITTPTAAKAALSTALAGGAVSSSTSMLNPAVEGGSPRSTSSSPRPTGSPVLPKAIRSHSSHDVNIPAVGSKPIQIRSSLAKDNWTNEPEAHLAPLTTQAETQGKPAAQNAEGNRDPRNSEAPRKKEKEIRDMKLLVDGQAPGAPAVLSPTVAMAPWLVLLNPSNPDMSKVDNVLLFSRWQHVFPRPSEMRVMKWKSLSSPAAVPLTTEYFPTKKQFETEYQHQAYRITQNTDDVVTEEPDSRGDLLRELIGARFSHGFQAVVGPNVAKASGQQLIKLADIFSPEKIAEDGMSLFMSIGNIIHQLSCVDGNAVEVNMYLRKLSLSGMPADPMAPVYRPAIRCTLDSLHRHREINIITPKPEKNWNYIDSYLAGHSDVMTERLGFWRARFVLIPVDGRTSPTPKHQTGDNEEEVRLEGIKRLAQAWQRHRYFPPSERRFQSANKLRDPNPLDIVYKTEDSSVVIAAEMETLPLFENVEAMHRKGQLVSNKERFSKSNFHLAALADAIQQPVESGGIRMQNRRWHLRLHHNCFIGSDMTTWLLDHFEDIESREEAVELGNSLMVYGDDKSKDREVSRDGKKDRGIFVHVERRHPFRDGQYFYQLVSDYAKPYGASWLSMRRKDLSVPSTPLLEQAARDSPRTGFVTRSRPCSIHEDQSPTSASTTPSMPMWTAKRPKVVLSKVMKYDVDHRKKSYRPERIELHYDRLHNPDNCYHIRIDWMNVTAKLIEDAVKGWASIATQHNLRLVEVPIAEACTISHANPFRRPHIIKLALPPPSQRPVTYFEPYSVPAQQTQSVKHLYEKALLRKLDFVLDIEAASNFPGNVDVCYSWGTPDFQYSQYIHRSGRLLVEITDEGDFLCLANRVYSNRAGSASSSSISMPAKERLSARLSSAAGYYTGTGGLPDSTPTASPMFRPALFGQTQAGDSRGASSEASPGLSSAPGLPAHTAAKLLPPVATKESEVLIAELEAFCHNPDALDAFYRDTLEKVVCTTPAVATSAGNFGEMGQQVPDAGIPVLGLPPGVLGVGAGPTMMVPRSATPTLSGSLALRRGSVQQQ